MGADAAAVCEAGAAHIADLASCSLDEARNVVTVASQLSANDARPRRLPTSPAPSGPPPVPAYVERPGAPTTLPAPDADEKEEGPEVVV